MMLITSNFNTSFGWLELVYDEHYIYRAAFVGSPKFPAIQDLADNLSKNITQELTNYFNNPHSRFHLALKPQGTHYQQKVWNALLVIPVGRTISYGELANQLQSSPRAIGQACKKNPLVLFIPCHRVVGKNNEGGYMGREEALCYKISLLNHEKLGT